MRTTIIYAPHPDDETLYLGSYLTLCRARGDRLVLVAVTNGGASGAKPDGWNVSELEGIRKWEQQSAWRNLTGKTSSSIVRMNLPDGGGEAALRDPVHAKAEELQAQFETDSTVEHYAACNNGRSQGVDHDATALGLRDAIVSIRRFANRCTDTGGTIYTPANDTALNYMQLADSSFEAFGHKSVAQFWQDYRASGYTNRIVT